MEEKLIRSSSHADSWYEGNKNALDKNLEKMLSQTQVTEKIN